MWPPATQVGGTDVPAPVTEVSSLMHHHSGCKDETDGCLFIQIANIATNDSSALSISQYAVLAIAPELAPTSFAALDSISESLAETSTVATSTPSLPLAEKIPEKTEKECVDHRVKRNGAWKRLLCFK